MMGINYYQGQKHYPIPYAKKKLIAYLSIAALLYVIHETIAGYLAPGSSSYNMVYYGTSFLFLALFSLLILKVERKELERLPYIGRFLSGTKMA